MRISVDHFWSEKAGNTQQEYEDAFFYSDVGTELKNFKCAIGDGATETSFSGIWANLLTRAFVENRLIYHLDEMVLSKLSLEWQETISTMTKEKPLSWYAEEKLRDGAFSSLIGLTIDDSGHWQASSIGDSCMFLIRRGKMITSLPFSDASQFNNRPQLLSTNPAKNRVLTTIDQAGVCQVGDLFVLMTDAIAHCFLSNWANQGMRYTFLRKNLDASFKNFVADLRAKKLCKNDDITFLKISIMELG